MNNSILSVNNLSMHFGGILALKGASFNVERNSITALIGPNGAGKTTLFNCLTGFYLPSAGTLLFYSKDKTICINAILGQNFRLKQLIQPSALFECLYFKMFGGSHLATKVGIVRTFQNIRLFREMTVMENLLVAQHIHTNRSILSGLFNTQHFRTCEKQDIEFAYTWLDKFQLTQDANRLAGGLPYGKQRHLEIARAMCTRPQLLCLDEPAAGLNPHESAELAKMILTLRKENSLSVLLIEHDMSVVMNISDHVIVLNEGEVICKGSPEIVRHNQQVIDAYLGVNHEN